MVSEWRKLREAGTAPGLFLFQRIPQKEKDTDATILKGNLGHTAEYNGCPYCGVRVFVVCDSCKKLNCQIISGDYFTCEWCGSTGRLTDYDGAGVQSGGDR